MGDGEDGPSAGDGDRPAGGDEPSAAPPGEHATTARWSGLREALARMRAERAALEQGTGEDLVTDTDGVSPDAPEHRSPLAPFRIGLLGGLGLLVAYALYLSLDTIRGTLIVLAISALIAIGLDPAVSLLMRRGLRRRAAVAITYLSLLAFVFGVFYAIIPPVVTQVAAFITALPDRLKELQHNPTIKSLDDRFGLIAKVQDYVTGLAPNAASGVFTAAGVAVDLVDVTGRAGVRQQMRRLVTASAPPPRSSHIVRRGLAM